MRGILAAGALALVGTSALGAAGAGGDGCYQMYVTGALYPVVCVSGSTEEGIGGSGARVALVGPNSSEVVWCATTTKIETRAEDASKFDRTFYFNRATGMVKIRFAGEVKGGREEGQVTLTETQDENKLEFLELTPQSLAKLTHVFTSKKCQEAR